MIRTLGMYGLIEDDVAGGRVVFVNAELHTLATDASPDFVYSSSSDVQPYARYWPHFLGLRKPATVR